MNEVDKLRRLLAKGTPASRLDHDFSERMRRDPHVVAIIEHDGDTHEVTCSCGFVSPAWGGERHAQKIKEQHLARFKKGPDPMGAKYRA